MKFIITYCTTPSIEGEKRITQQLQVSKKIAKELLTKKLCACVNIVPKVTSMYWWEDKIQEDEEQMLIIKSKLELESEMKEVIINNHPYKVCEIISTEIIAGNEKYLEWIGSSTKSE